VKIPGHRLEKKIGQGGMAAVYLGVQEAFDRKVAIKILTPKTTADQEFATRFLREAKTVAQLSHSNIIPVYDFGEVGGYYYMSMEYLPGGSLSTLVKSGLELEEALPIIEDIASALDFAHSKGIIHRDVKPENIMFRENHDAVLTDFGIAKRKDASDGVTVAGAVMGTPKYMSPEQIGGKELDGRCDIYALGVMFYEMLMTHVPYQSEDYMALAMMHVRDPIPRLSLQFANAQHFLEKMMAKDREERFRTGEEVAKAARQLRETGQYQTGTRISGSASKPTGVRSGSFPSANTTRGMPVVTAKKSAVKQGIWESEQITKKGFFRNKYQFSCRIVCEDHNRFSNFFSAMADKVLEWHQHRKGSCESIALEISIPADDEGKVRAALKSLYRRGEAFRFLAKVPIDAKLIFLDTLETRTFRVRP
jgi:serine/threonine-protein kinase PpkA